MRSPNYPAADRSTQWFEPRYPGAKTNPNVVVLHTTETSNWPGYNDGATAPNFTVKADPLRKELHFRQHFPANMSSRALRNEAGGVETNTLNAVQVELVGTCDRRTAAANPGFFYWPQAPDWALEQLAEFLRWLHDEWPDFPLKDAAPRGWLPYPDSYGNGSGQRMTFAEWRGAYGVVGHQHVPENSHGDPGDFPIERLIEMAAKRKTEPRRPSLKRVAKPTWIRVGTANIRSFPWMRIKLVREDYRRLKGKAQVWSLQEIRPLWYRRLLLTILGPPRFRMRRLTTGESIVFESNRFKWLYAPKVATLLHESVPFVSGRRNINYIWLWDRIAKHRYAHISVHFTPKQRKNERAQKAADEGFRNLRALISRQMWNHGVSHFIIGGDFNCDADEVYRQLGEHIEGYPVRVVRMTDGGKGRKASIDHIVLVGRFEVGEKGELTGQNSDHRPFWVDVRPV